MRSKPRFHKQETRYSCVPACLRMVLSSFGVELTESELRIRCDTTPFDGTNALKAVDAVRELGFAGTAKHTLTLAELRSLVIDGHYPIIFVDLRPLDGVRDIHALVVLEVSESVAIALDPLAGERALPLRALDAAWTMARNLVIMIEQS